MATGSSKPRRRKHKLEPIGIEELYSTSNMSGFVSFLQTEPGTNVSLPHLAAGAAPQAEASASVTSAPETSAPVVSAPIADAPSQVSASDTGAPITSAPETGALETTPPSRRRPPRLREAHTVQDGHSHGEQAVYDALYRSARPYQGDEIRLLTIGYRTLAERSRMAYSNCKLNVRSLVEKLAIEPVGDFSYTDGTTFLVYGYREVLRRRRAAGLTHFIRQRGVTFVDPATGRELTGRTKGKTSAPVLSAPGSLDFGEMSALETVKTSAPDTIKTSALISGAHIRNTPKEENRQSSTTDDRRAVIQALRTLIPTVDDEAADHLITACREHAPDATTEEICHFIAAKGEHVLRRREVRNPVGLLQVAVPKCFQGESFRLYREAEGQKRAQMEAAAAAARAEWNAVLADPHADEDLKQLARRALDLS